MQGTNPIATCLLPLLQSSTFWKNCQISKAYILFKVSRLSGVRRTENREVLDGMEEAAERGYQGKQYRAQPSRASDYHDDGLEINCEEDKADSHIGDGRPYHAQWSRASNIHPAGLPDTVEWAQSKIPHSEGVDSEMDSEEVGIVILL